MPNNQAVSAKEKFLKGVKSATPVNTHIIRKQNSLITDNGESLSGLDISSNQPRHSLKSKPNPEQGPNSLQFYEG